MRPTALLLILVCLLLSLGCNVVTTPHQVGEPVAGDLAGELDGVWEIGDEVWHVKFLKDGRLALARAEWGGERFRLTELSAVLTRGEDTEYLHFLDPDSPPDRPRYLLARQIRDEGMAVLWFPKVEVFKAAVETGELQGKLDDGDVELAGTRERLIEFLRAPAHERFELEAPLVARRIGSLD